MEATFYVRAVDVHEAARLTYNAILQKRRDLEDEAVARWEKSRRRKFVAMLLGAETETDYRMFISQHQTIKVHQTQADTCHTLVNLADGVMRTATMYDRDPKKETMGITLPMMSAITLGWEKMMDAWRDERARFDETKGDLPMPKFVKDTDEEKIIEFDGIKYKSKDAPNWREWVPEPML